MKLESKIIAFLGDSITEGAGVANHANRYDNRMLRDCKLAGVRNYGIGGSRLAHQTKPSDCPRFDLCFCGRAYNIDPAADIIVVYGGVNDFLHGDAPFGEMGDATPATFCGAVRWLMNFMKTQYANKTVVFMTPARCNGKFGTLSAGNNLPLRRYVEVILATAKELEIPILNLFDDLGINAETDEDMARYTADGLHFNDAGHAILAEKLTAFLEVL